MDAEQLKAKTRRRQPIEGAHFTDVDWSDLDCENATFTDCLIKKAQLTNVNFAGARFCAMPVSSVAGLLDRNLSDATFAELCSSQCGNDSSPPDAHSCSVTFADTVSEM